MSVIYRRRQPKCVRNMSLFICITEGTYRRQMIRPTQAIIQADTAQLAVALLVNAERKARKLQLPLITSRVWPDQELILDLPLPEKALCQKSDPFPAYRCLVPNKPYAKARPWTLDPTNIQPSVHQFSVYIYIGLARKSAPLTRSRLVDYTTHVL